MDRLPEEPHEQLDGIIAEMRDVLGLLSDARWQLGRGAIEAYRSHPNLQAASAALGQLAARLVEIVGQDNEPLPPQPLTNEEMYQRLGPVLQGRIRERGIEISIVDNTAIKVAGNRTELTPLQTYIINVYLSRDEFTFPFNMLVQMVQQPEESLRDAQSRVRREMSVLMGRLNVHSRILFEYNAAQQGKKYIFASSVYFFDRRPAAARRPQDLTEQDIINQIAAEIAPPDAPQPPQPKSRGRAVDVTPRSRPRFEGIWATAADIAAATELPEAIVWKFIEQNRHRIGSIFARSRSRSRGEEFSPNFTEWAVASLDQWRTTQPKTSRQ